MKGALSCLAVVVASALASTVASRARADDDDVEGAASLELHLAHSDLVLGDASFSGTGADSAGYVRSFSTTGTGIGLVRPHVAIYDVALSGHVGKPHDAQIVMSLVLGGGSTSADQIPTDAAAAARMGPDFTFFRAGLEFGTGAYFGPLYAQASMFFGGASIWTSMNGLTSCDLRGCSGDAYAAHGWIQPRAMLQLELPASLTLGAYVGDNLVHTDEVEMGLTLGIRLWSERAKDAFDLSQFRL